MLGRISLSSVIEYAQKIADYQGKSVYLVQHIDIVRVYHRKTEKRIMMRIKPSGATK